MFTEFCKRKTNTYLFFTKKNVKQIVDVNLFCGFTVCGNQQRLLLFGLSDHSRAHFRTFLDLTQLSFRFLFGLFQIVFAGFSRRCCSCFWRHCRCRSRCFLRHHCNCCLIFKRTCRFVAILRKRRSRMRNLSRIT